jgi:type I restriction enzyme S subunit
MTQKSKEGRNVPNLRFPGFDDEWEHKKLGDIAKFSKGKGISKSDINESGTTECIRYGELYTYYGEVIEEVKSKTNNNQTDLLFSEANDVIIPASGETQIDIATASCVVKSGVALGGDLNIIKTPNNGVFLSYYLNSKKKTEIAKLAQGNSVVHLYSSQLALLKLDFPCSKEQTKIASFLTLLDNRINTQIKIIENLESLMKGLSQRIFTQQLRFKNDNGNDFPNWERKRLGDIGQTFNGLTGKTKADFGGGKPYIQYMQIFNGSKINPHEFGFVKIKGDEYQNTTQYGDVFFTTSSETPNEIGTSSVLLNDVEELYLNSFCFGYRPNSINDLVPEFAQFLFRSDPIRRKITPLAQGSTRFNMSKKELMKLSFGIPCPEEQTKIANFLSSIDEKIEKEKQILAQYQHQKKHLLQNLFI